MKDFCKYLLMAIAFYVLSSILFAVPVMLLWNWLMPMIFGLTKITFLQSLGIMLLFGLLFKSPNTK